MAKLIRWLAGFVVIGALVSATLAYPPKSKPKADAEIKTQVEAWLAAFKAKDSAKVMSF